MDEQKFDKSLKDILENAPPFEPSEEAIGDIRQRLDQAYGRRRWWIPWWWWVPLLILPFASGMIFFFLKFKTLNNKLDEINLQLSVQKIDTITSNYIIYHYDTIYSKVILTQRGEQPFLNPRSFPGNNVYGYELPGGRLFNNAVPSIWGTERKFFTNNPSLLKQIESGQITLTDLSQSLPVLSPSEKEIDTRSWDKMEHLFNSYTPSLNGTNFFAEKIQVPYSVLAPPFLKTKPIRRPLVQGVQIGAFAGLAPLTEYSNSLLWELNLDLLFSSRFRLRTGFQNIGINFEEKEEDHFEDYPSVEPDNPGDELKEIKAEYSFMRIPFRFMYTFSSPKSIQPYFGIGLSAIKAIRPELKYEFIGDNEEYYKTFSFSNPGFSIQNVEFGLGLEFYLGSGINVSAEGFRFQNFDSSIEQINQISHFGGKVGLHYTF